MQLLVGGSSHFRSQVLGAVLLLAVATAGCGGQSKAQDGTADEKPEQAASTGAEAQGSTASTVTPKKSSGSSGGATPTTAAATAKSGAAAQKSDSTPTTVDPYTRTLKIEAELQESCVRPGGSQTVTVRTLPYAGVAYDTQYSDYLTGMMEGHYGGNGAGFTDDDGTYTSTWVITPNAPAGNTTVLVLGSHQSGGIGETKVFFNVSDALGKCG